LLLGASWWWNSRWGVVVAARAAHSHRAPWHLPLREALMLFDTWHFGS